MLLATQIAIKATKTNKPLLINVAGVVLFIG